MTLRTLAVAALLAAPLFGNAGSAPSAEKLDRGLVGLRQDDGSVWLSWRLLASEPSATFQVWRKAESADKKDKLVAKIDAKAPTWVVDKEAPAGESAYYVSVASTEGKQADSAAFAVPARTQAKPYLSIPIEAPAGAKTPEGVAYTYDANDGSVGDLDGDGRLEIVLKWNPSNAKDNSHSGITGNTIIDAYTLEGKRLWRIDLGPNIRSGAHYTQFMVADFNGDGCAEMICKTSDGTIDGEGSVIGDAKADHRNERGHIVRGAELLTAFDGRTGKAIDTVPYQPARHPSLTNPDKEALKAVWGDGNGNRSERYLAGVASLDGKTLSAVMCRGYYTRATLAAWDLRDGKLQLRWSFDSDDGKPGHKAYHGQGNHSLSIADVDGDGKDEVVYGAAVYDDNGEGLYSTGWGHADAMHVSDLVPANPGLEVFNIQERADKQGMNMRDARTGRALFLVPTLKGEESGPDKGEGPGRGVSFNIDPRHPGSESWATGASMSGLYNAQGERIGEKRPKSCNFAVWWDGDYLRELLDKTYISKWNWAEENETQLLNAVGCESNNGTKGTPVLSGDILGDWREEVIWRSSDNKELRLYTTTIPTTHRHVTLLADHQYRMALAWQNTAYNQPPHPSFALDEAKP